MVRVLQPHDAAGLALCPRATLVRSVTFKKQFPHELLLLTSACGRVYCKIVTNASEELGQYIFRAVSGVQLSDAQWIDHSDLNSNDNR
jgi:hypothetical protein